MEWNTKSTATSPQQFYVLRNKSKLRGIEQFIQAKTNHLPEVDENCLIPVTLSMNGRGNPGKCSIICLQNKSDIRRARGNSTGGKRFQSPANRPPLTQPVVSDKNEYKRKLLRSQHLQLLKRLRRKRVRVKRKSQEYAERKVIIAPPQTAKLISQQYDRMCELWLPIAPQTIRHQCVREVFGYLTQCQFMFHEAKVCGIGYVTINGIRDLSRWSARPTNQVLVRDSTSLNYHLAKISIRYH